MWLQKRQHLYSTKTKTQPEQPRSLGIKLTPPSFSLYCPSHCNYYIFLNYLPIGALDGAANY